uniref:CUE domain-containing protein n=1 Tax=Wuchereria bancrofti TaxID=6293 RepID=A0A1I8EU59_WUCBA
MAEISSSTTTSAPHLSNLFVRDRYSSSTFQRFLLYSYIPFGILLFCLRVIIGVHIFLTACILRKTMLLRCTVLRVMSCLLGLVVLSGGPARDWDHKTHLLVANHISTLDHLAIDLIEPCILPSVWDIPSILRWCLGYKDLGARQGRAELIRRSKIFCEKNTLPLLTFPEGAMTSGSTGLLKFSTWPFEVSDSVQPVLISVYRPFFGNIAVSVLGGAWWQDVFYFLFVPFTIMKVQFFIPVRWLHPLHRRKSSESNKPSETTEEFTKRVADIMAAKLGIAATSFTSQDAVEEAKRHLEGRQRSFLNIRLNNDSLRKSRSWQSVKSITEYLDSLTMKIKQAFPAVPLLAIREDLEQTQDGNATCERITAGKIKLNPFGNDDLLPGTNPQQWSKVYSRRKWNLIETNRAKYLKRISEKLSAEQLEHETNS